MKSVFRFILCVLIFGVAVLPSPAAFTSLFVFGDGVSTTTDNLYGGADYYGLRYSNGRVWVEVLAQRQGLTFESSKNWSFFGHYSPNLVGNVTSFVAPPDVGSSLFIVWVNNADFVYTLSQNNPPYNNSAIWTDAMNRSLSNHFTAIQTLYNKGVRTLIMPNAVDLMKVPNYTGLLAADKSFVRQRVIDYNIAFAARLNQARASFPNLTIHSPDVFSLLDDVVAHAGSYGLTNTLSNLGQSIDALSDPNLANKSLNGPGTNYIFWDDLNPTAKLQAVIADLVQQLIAPVYISGIAPLTGTNQLVIGNTPVGRNGVVDGSTNFVNWIPAQSITSSNVTQTVLVPAAGPWRCYRLRFPFSWSWP